jgi:hypothetical protein
MWTRGQAAQHLEAPDSIDEEITKTIAAIARLAPPGPLTRPQARRLVELGSFVETMNLNDMTGWPRGGEFDEIREVWYRLVAQLGGFDVSTLAAQARLISEDLQWDESRRVGRHPDRDAYFSLFDGAEARNLEHWESVDVVEAGRDLAVHLLAGGPGLTVVAAQALATHPDRNTTAAAIERRLPDIPRRSTPAAVLAFLHASNFDSEDIERLSQHERSAVRSAVASLTDPLEGDHLTEVARALLADDERDVQNAVLDRLERHEGGFSPQLTGILTSLSETPPRPFNCTWCGARSPASRRSCASCNVVNERPDQNALKILERMTPETVESI